LRQLDFPRSNGNSPVGGDDVDQLFIVDPPFNPFVGDAQANAIPAASFEVNKFCRIVFGSIRAVKAGDAQERAAPAARNEAAAGVIDRDGETAKEIGTADAHRFKRDFIVDAWDVVGPVQAGKREMPRF